MSKGTGIQYYIPSSNVEALENNDVLPYLTNYHHTKHDRSLFKLLT